MAVKMPDFLGYRRVTLFLALIFLVARFSVKAQRGCLKSH
jgi:hypothetical protein